MRERWITDWTPSRRWPHYTRANAGEVVPTPASPLSVTFSWDNGMCQGWRDGYVRVGAFSADEFDDAQPESCGFFGGYLYINLSNVRMQGVRNPAVTVEQLDLAFFGEHPGVPPYEPHPADDRPDLVPGILENLGWITTTTSWAPFEQERDETVALRVDRPDLSTLRDAELLVRARTVQNWLRRLFDSHTITSSSSGVAPAIFGVVAQALGDPSITMKLLAGIGNVDSAEPSIRLWELSREVRRSPALTAAFDLGVEDVIERLTADGSPESTAFLAGWDRFLADFGARGPNEYEISADCWETRPQLALATLERVRLQLDGESPTARSARKAQEREAVTADVRRRLADLGNEELSQQFEAGLVATNQMAFRERTKTNLIRAVHEARMIFVELGRRHADAGDLAEARHVFQLLDSELDAFVADPGKFTDELASRAEEWAQLWELEPPFIIRDGRVPPLGAWARRRTGSRTAAETGAVIPGIAGCPGKVRGRARIVTDVTDPAALEPGEILVAPATDPGWASLFMAAAGVVVEVGGQISHAIIVSRELGLPCVVSATGATQLIETGALVEVDGDSGSVTVLERP